MRTTLVLSARKKLPGAPVEVRLFTMTEEQAKLYTKVVAELVRQGVPETMAESMTEDVINKMMGGTMPSDRMPRVFHELRLKFPILRPKDVRALPLRGCPRGHVRGIILPIRITHEDAPEVDDERVIRYDLSGGQADVFNQAIAQVQKMDNCSRDDAWEFCCKIVGRLLAGANPVEHGAHPMLVRLAEHFSGLTWSEAIALPRATEADVRLLQFREEEHAET